MIGSFRDRDLEDFYVDGILTSEIPPDLRKIIRRKLDRLNFASRPEDYSAMPGDRFKKMKPPLDGFYSIRVNDRWRLVFRINPGTGAAEDVYLDDHSYQPRG